MAICSSILAWRIPWTEEPGILVYRVTQSQTRLKWLSTHHYMKKWLVALAAATITSYLSNPLSNSTYKEQVIHTPVTTALRLACLSSIQSILLLGGYVTFVNAFRAIPELLHVSGITKAILGGFLEIVYGIPGIFNNKSLPSCWKCFCIMTSLSFSGICCMLQTSSITIEENLSMKKYVFHKTIITGIATIYYFILFL